MFSVIGCVIVRVYVLCCCGSSCSLFLCGVLVVALVVVLVVFVLVFLFVFVIVFVLAVGIVFVIVFCSRGLFSLLFVFSVLCLLLLLSLV